MKATPIITVAIEGTLSELLGQSATHPTPSMGDVLASLRELAFIVETVAHLQGKEAALLPSAERARDLISQLEPRTIL